MEKTLKTNGLKVRSYGDIVAVATLLAMLLSVVAWGLKLEGELNTLRDTHGGRISALEGRVADGILPRAEERINHHDDKFRDHDRRIERLEERQ